MRKKVFQLSMFIISLTLVMGLFINVTNHNQVEAEDGEKSKNEPVQNEYYTVIDENGDVIIKYYDDEDNKIQTLSSNDYEVIKKTGDEEEVLETYDTYEEAQKILNSRQRMRTFSISTYEIEAISKAKNISCGVAYLNGYIEYKEIENGKSGRAGYTHGSSAYDAAYISTSNDGKTVRVKQAGVVMDIPASKVEVVEYNGQSKVSYYYGKSGKFYHYYYSGDGDLNSTQVGYTPSYLSDGIKYYSYDGHYFYKDYKTMINDYKAGYDYYSHAINANNPYYNYYQYLSFRSSTQFQASDFNKLVTDTKGSNTNSKLKNQGQAFINAQNSRGINASLMFGVAINESGWGLSKYAMERNNLFGLGAVDSNPDKALNFNSIEECLVYFSYNTLSSGYLDGMDYRYRGPHLGDKRSGINVKYASDPYWGEKAASFSYRLNANTNNKDYQKYTIGISKKTAQNLYSDSSLTKKIYDSSVNDKTSEQLYCYPVTILSSEGNSYKILSDTVLNSNRTAQDYDGYFNLSKDYVYVSKNDINILGQIIVNTYKPGDVNGDGKVSSLDYIKIKNHIMGTSQLMGASLSRADVNEDGKVSSLDYIKIKNHIMGTNKLF